METEIKLQFSCKGHANILATHRNTLECTKEKTVTKTGECIVGVSADFNEKELMIFVHKGGEAMLTMKINDLFWSVMFTLNPQFCSKNELVIRRSEFLSDRTLGIKSDKAACEIPNEMRTLLSYPNTIIDMVLSYV